jgi:molybdopterin-containing oxidoreductase family iron-sulfur binding subunit
VNGQTVAVPVLIQPGQAVGTVGLAVGYGRTLAGKVGNNVGVNAYPFAGKVDEHYVYFNTADIQVTPIGESYEIAQTQTHETYMGRETVIQEATLAAYQENPMAGRFVYELATSEGKADPEDISLWHGHRYPNHHWGMVIDLNSCTGCGACTIACVAENNVPVVGKKEVLMRREMHWLRIDRYYSSDAPVDDLKGLEKASENPDVTFQPMLCQQCNTAPCETVCPVLATTHSSEGLNQMTYNRCIGTRYCANNCPYKVRRFNWFKYHDNDRFPENLAMNNDLGKMVLNPDVTVRARGVMEKCTFCVQRIQAGKLEARREGRNVRDGEIVTACASACPTDAIIFGDMNDPDSRVSQLLQEEVQGRAYHVLQEIRTLPNISYLTKIRNKENTESEA